MKSVNTLGLAAGLLGAALSTSMAQDRIGPSFSCDAATTANQPLAQAICSSADLSIAELRYVIAYQALRHSIDDRGKQALAKEANELVVSTNDICKMQPAAQKSTSFTQGQLDCIKRSFEIARRNILERLQGPGLEEAKLDPADALRLQKLLKDKVILPADAKVDGVFGPATRTAIKQYQRLLDKPDDGFASSQLIASSVASSNSQAGGYDYGRGASTKTAQDASAAGITRSEDPIEIKRRELENAKAQLEAARRELADIVQKQEEEKTRKEAAAAKERQDAEAKCLASIVCRQERENKQREQAEAEERQRKAESERRVRLGIVHVEIACKAFNGADLPLVHCLSKGGRIKITDNGSTRDYTLLELRNTAVFGGDLQAPWSVVAQTGGVSGLRLEVKAIYPDGRTITKEAATNGIAFLP